MIPAAEPEQPAWQQLRDLLQAPEQLVRAVASGRQRARTAQWTRAELRPVQVRSARRWQLTTTDGGSPLVRNLDEDELSAVVADLLAQPFANWFVRTTQVEAHLRVTKGGTARLHQVRREQPEQPEQGAPTGAHDRAKQHLIDPGDPLFTALGADAAKRRQVDAFVRQVAVSARRLLARTDQDGLEVVDLGCGNAYLTMAAHRYLTTLAADLPSTPRVHTRGVDQRPEMALRNTALAHSLGLSHLEFEAGQIADVSGRADLVLALHACDTATDDALAQAVRQQAAVILAAPCCHHDLQRQLSAAGRQPPFATLTRHAIVRERFADVLTDALRADLLRLVGYRVDVVEFVSSAHTPRNVLIRAVHTGAPPSPRLVAQYLEVVQAWQVQPALAQRLHQELTVVLATADRPTGQDRTGS